MKTNILFFIGLLTIFSCGQGEKNQGKLTFSNDYLVGGFSSEKNGDEEFKIVKQGDNYILMQKIARNQWTEGERLSEISNEQLDEKFGDDWTNILSAALTSGMCDYYRLQPGQSLGGITMGAQPDTEYVSRCFADNYLYKVK